ncbi:hypothetical protein ABPG74_019181 [Tetrahymena malaccensis]
MIKINGAELISRECQNPCQNQIDKILPGAILGFVSTDFTYQVKQIISIRENLIFWCCGQQKTSSFSKGFIVPDFVDVEFIRTQDRNNFQGVIKPLSNIGKENFVDRIDYFFRRVELQLKNNTQIYANMTAILQIAPKPNKCEFGTKNFKNWQRIYSYLGKKIYTNVQVGAQFHAAYEFITNQYYNFEQLISLYKQYIAKKTLDTIMGGYSIRDELKNNEMDNIKFYQCDNFEDYLSKLGLSNYAQILDEYQTNLDVYSYTLFDAESNEIKECSKKVWKNMFQSSTY